MMVGRSVADTCGERLNGEWSALLLGEYLSSVRPGLNTHKVRKVDLGGGSGLLAGLASLDLFSGEMEPARAYLSGDNMFFSGDNNASTIAALDVEPEAGKVSLFPFTRIVSGSDMGGGKISPNSDFQAGADLGEGTVMSTLISPCPDDDFLCTSSGAVNGIRPLVGVYPRAEGLAMGRVGVVCLVGLVMLARG